MTAFWFSALYLLAGSAVLHALLTMPDGDLLRALQGLNAAERVFAVSLALVAIPVMLAAAWFSKWERKP